MKLKNLKMAFPYTIPVMLGYLSLGIAFGLLLESCGYPFYLATFMSIVIYAGSMQFVTINLLTGGAGIVSTILMTLMVNARHLFYGLSMLEKFRSMGRKKPYMIFSLTDETYSLLCGLGAPAGTDANSFYFWIALLNQLYWIIGSTAGAIAGSLIKFDSTGIDFAMTALFVVIFVEQWESVKAQKTAAAAAHLPAILSSLKAHLPALIGVAVTIVCRLVFGADSFIVFSMIGIFILLCAGKPILDTAGAADEDMPARTDAGADADAADAQPDAPQGATGSPARGDAGAADEDVPLRPAPRDDAPAPRNLKKEEDMNNA